MTMSLTAEQVYGVRFGPKLALPKIVQDNIASLRITPVPFKAPYRAPQRGYAKKPAQPDNWRENALVESVRRVKERDDPEYDDVFSSLNKISTRTLDKLSEKIVANIKKRDEIFRLRVTTLLFDMAISQSGYAMLMADCAKKLAAEIPEICEDLVVQTEMFPKLYNMTETLIYPSSEQTGYADKVIEWMKLKDKRRGYAKFMTQLFVRELVAEKMVGECMTHVSADLAAMAKQEKSEHTEENTTQYVDFLFETAKILPASAKELRVLMHGFIDSVLQIPRAELPSLNMRSRFKLEDAIKCVQ
jgi:hypothetical protein